MAYNPKKNTKFLANKPVYSETKSSVETNILNLNTNIGKEIVELQKRHYGTKDASRVLDRSFVELTRTKDSLTPETFFNLYRELFYDLPKTGNNSHTLLINESKNYVKDYVDPKDDIIDELTQKIVDFERENVEIPSEHPIFSNGTAIRVKSANGTLGALGIMQEGRFRLVSNQGDPSPFRQLKRPLGFVDSEGKLLPDNDCFTFISPQAFNNLPKFTDPLSLSAINENADYSLTLREFTPPSTNFSEIANLISTAELKKEDINFLIRRLNKKIPFDGYTIEDNENTFTWDPVDLLPFNVKGQFQGEVKLYDNFFDTTNEDPIGGLIENLINDWVEEIESISDLNGPVTEANIKEYRSIRQSDINVALGLGSSATAANQYARSERKKRRQKINSADNVLIANLESLNEDIENDRFIPYIWTNDPDRTNNVKFYWVERSGDSSQFKNRVNSVANSLQNRTYDSIIALSTI